MRLPFTTTVPRSITFRWSIVTMRAFVSATLPVGTSRGTLSLRVIVSVRPRVHVAHVVVRAAAVLERLVVAPARKESAVARQLRDRELAAPFLDALRIAANAAQRERRDVDVVAFLERDLLRRPATGRSRRPPGKLRCSCLSLPSLLTDMSAVPPRPPPAPRTLVDPEDPAVGSERTAARSAVAIRPRSPTPDGRVIVANATPVSPPAAASAETRTSSYQPLCVSVRCRAVAPSPRATIDRAPSGLHTGST